MSIKYDNTRDMNGPFRSSYYESKIVSSTEEDKSSKVYRNTTGSLNDLKDSSFPQEIRNANGKGKPYNSVIFDDSSKKEHRRSSFLQVPDHNTLPYRPYEETVNMVAQPNPKVNQPTKSPRSNNYIAHDSVSTQSFKGRDTSVGEKPQDELSTRRARNTEKVFKEDSNKNNAFGMINIGQMNVRELIELKNIIDERIEIEELKNKRVHRKTSPNRIIQKAEEIIRSPDNKRFSRQDPMDIERQKDASYQRETLRNNRSTAERFNENEQSRKISFEQTFDAPTRDNTNQNQVEMNYARKLEEFLEARDSMLKLKETQSDIVNAKKNSARQPNFSVKDNISLSSNRLYEFTSPVNNQSSIINLPKLTETDLLQTPSYEGNLISNKSANTTIGSYKNNKFFDTEVKRELSPFGSSRIIEPQVKPYVPYNYSEIKDLKQDMWKNDLLNLVNNMDTNQKKPKANNDASKYTSQEEKQSNYDAVINQVCIF